MKTLDEVIGIFEAYSKCRYDLYEGPGQQTVTDALHYLKLLKTHCDRVQNQIENLREEHRPNDPLTWDELQQMEGKPVWIETSDSFNRHRWMFVGEWFDEDEMRLFDMGNDYPDYVSKNGYESGTWQAYRKERE